MIDNNMRLILLGLGAVLAASFVLRKVAAAPVEAIANVNVDTPFEGFGAVGTVGNVTDKLSGGFFATIGGAIGRGLFSIFGEKLIGFDELDDVPEIFGPPDD